MKRFIVISFVILGLLGLTPNAQAFNILPTTNATIFDFDTSDVILNFINVGGGQVRHTNSVSLGQVSEDRAFFEYDISSLAVPVTSAMLYLNVLTSNGPLPFPVDVYAYGGDGVTQFADFGAGTLAHSFAFNGQASVALDMTTSLNNLILANADYLSLSLRTDNIYLRNTTADPSRYVVFDGFNQDTPSFLAINEPHAVPEPLTLSLFGLGLLGFIWKTRR